MIRKITFTNYFSEFIHQVELSLYVESEVSSKCIHFNLGVKKFLETNSLDPDRMTSAVASEVFGTGCLSPQRAYRYTAMLIYHFHKNKQFSRFPVARLDNKIGLHLKLQICFKNIKSF